MKHHRASPSQSSATRVDRRRDPVRLNLYRRFEDAYAEFRSHSRQLADSVLWPLAGTLSLLSVFVVLSPLIGIRWVPRAGHLVLAGSAVLVCLTRQLWLAVAAGGRATSLGAKLVLHERAEQQRMAKRARSDAQQSTANLPIPADQPTADLPRPAMPPAEHVDDLPRVSAGTPESRRSDLERHSIR